MKEERAVAVAVSVICTAYNHERYIAEALGSFLEQRADFEYEVLVNDDASTDSTADIIREFERRSGGVIRGFYQKENLYSKRISIISRVLLPESKGKYIALCEGDDYWTDPCKLQRQYDYMESHPLCSLCVHQVEKVDALTGRKRGSCTPCAEERDYDTPEVILGGGGLFGTNSMFFLRENAVGYERWRPETCPVGDYPMAIYHSTLGAVHYFPETMSVYRTGAVGSWSSHMSAAGASARTRHVLAVSEMLDQINERTDRRFEDAIRRHQKDNLFSDAVERGDWRAIKLDGDLEARFREMGAKGKAGFYLKGLSGLLRGRGPVGED